MKIKNLLLICVTLIMPLMASGAEAPAATAGDDAPPQLRGLLAVDGERQFSLVTPGRMAPTWVKLGGKFDGWELADFKAAEEALVLKKNGRTVTLKLAGSSVANAPAAATKATIADAEDVLRKMDFERMMGRIIEQQKTAIVNMTRQMSAGAGASGADADDMAAFQKKTMDVMFEALNPEGMKNDMARIYSETFTKDELRGLSDFYGTPSGQAMVEKQPEVSQKLNAIMMPRMMSAMPKIQAMAKEFAAAQMEKREAAADAAAAKAAAPATAPTK